MHTPLLLLASVSPVYSNNPAFYSLTLEGSQLRRVAAYWADLASADPAAARIKPSLDWNSPLALDNYCP